MGLGTVGAEVGVAGSGGGPCGPRTGSRGLCYRVREVASVLSP